MSFRLILLATAAFAVNVSAQSSASLSGTVTDSSNARIPGVEVTATAGGHTVSTATDASGRFELRGLPLGQCRVTARLPGFRIADASIALATASEHRLDLKLRLGCVSDGGLPVILNVRESWEGTPTALVLRTSLDAETLRGRGRLL